MTNKLLFLICFTGFLFISNCTLSNNKKFLDEWTSNSCCKSDSTFLQIDALQLINRNKLIISFCEKTNSKAKFQLDLIFKSKENNSKEIFLLNSISPISSSMIEISSNEKPSNFDGLFSESNEFLEGDYRLYINTGLNCGEILFEYYKGKFIIQEFICVKKCMLPVSGSSAE